MAEAVIVDGVRTPIGTAYKGSLTTLSAFDLANVVVSELVTRNNLLAEDVDDLILAESMYGGGVIARHVAVELGLSAIPGLAVNRHCAGGLSAVTAGAANIMAGMQHVVLAGGTHSQSTAPGGSWRVPSTGEKLDFWMSPPNPDTPTAPSFDMPFTVGHNAAVETGQTRQDMDEWALESHRKAVAAIQDGRLAQEIVALKVTKGDETVVFDTDEHPRANTSMERLASLPVLRPAVENFQITAGNSAGLNDAAAGLLLMSAEKAAERGMTALATVRSWASVGVEPERTGMGPVYAIPKALAIAGRSVSDVDLWEINEAFASVPVAATRVLGIDPALVNPVGSGCSLGHPIAATGSRMIVSLVNELRRRGGGIGVAAMCAGGGMGQAVVIDVHA